MSPATRHRPEEERRSPHGQSEDGTRESGGLDPERDGLEVPLLGPAAPAGGDSPSSLVSPAKATVLQSSFNLVNTIIGAGEMALPAAFQVLGLFGGLVSTLFVWWVMNDSIRTLVRSSRRKGLQTYGELVEHHMGRAGGALVRVSLVLTCLGFLISYVIIFGDLLVGGAPYYAGILPSLLGCMGGPLPWYLHRHIVVGVVCVFAVYPLTCMRSLERLSIASVLKCLVTILFTCMTVSAAVAVGVQGQMPTPRFWPDISGPGDGGWQAAARLIAVIPVVLTAYSCHFNIHPLMLELADPTEVRVMTVANAGLGASTVVFLAVAISGCLTFGDQTKPDVLENYAVSSLAPLLGLSMAIVVSNTLNLGYFCLLICTYPLLNWPFRENLLEIFGSSSQAMMRNTFYGVSAALLAIVYVIATAVPNIWIALSLMGSTSGVAVIFLFPGLIQVLSAKETAREDLDTCSSRALWLEQGRGAFLIAIGAIVGCAGMYSTFAS